MDYLLRVGEVSGDDRWGKARGGGGSSGGGSGGGSGGVLPIVEEVIG